MYVLHARRAMRELGGLYPESVQMADEITEGSVVRLKSGGPTMTVTKMLSGGQAHCKWFDDKTLLQGDFPPVSLVSVNAEGQPFYTG
jgi:uncharacterized protein YodC (DUF2158 family)